MVNLRTPQERLNAGMMSTKNRMFAITEEVCRQIDQVSSPQINLDKLDQIVLGETDSCSKERLLIASDIRVKL